MPDVSARTLELAFWINRLKEITSVLAVNRLERIDKEACYRVYKHTLSQFMVNYKIPPVSKIAVDEGYARSNAQRKEDETCDDVLRDSKELWNYFKFKVTTGISEGINRAIKGLKWQAYGYKDMQYFALKILQKVGYLNTRSLFQNS